MATMATENDASTSRLRRELPEGSGGPLDPSILRPVKPHDAMRFHELSRSYNFYKTTERKVIFTRLLIDEIMNRPGLRESREPVRALDVGSGGGISGDPDLQRLVSAHADEMWGTEWDSKNVPVSGVFDKHMHGDVCELGLPEAYFDLAYSFLVMEHAKDPLRVLRCMYRSLKPGGVYVFLTYNGRHPFTRIATALRRLRLEEIVLKIITSNAERRWHYPVEYHCQHESQIEALAQSAGFGRPEFVYLENGEVDGAFRGWRRPLRAAIRARRRRSSNPRDLVTMIARLVKPL